MPVMTAADESIRCQHHSLKERILSKNLQTVIRTRGIHGTASTLKATDIPLIQPDVVMHSVTLDCRLIAYKIAIDPFLCLHCTDCNKHDAYSAQYCFVHFITLPPCSLRLASKIKIGAGTYCFIQLVGFSHCLGTDKTIAHTLPKISKTPSLRKG